MARHVHAALQAAKHRGVAQVVAVVLVQRRLVVVGRKLRGTQRRLKVHANLEFVSKC